MFDRLNLGGRAALAVPVIAPAIGALVALVSLALATEDALIKGWSLAYITFVYATIIALPVGIALAFPAVLLGHLLPEPRFGWLIAIGAVTSGGPAALLSLPDAETALGAALIFGMIGAVAAWLWWHFVERHREMEPAHD
ncbi:hypothetical protein [Erythrobacter oryzae]|uniref:hypothetical protein n=1 Tax=Erythrobacter oryzae TaxID=3019556 RepID=UPI0025556E3F|nr:hypothetical protein [Erythrobacter sp. COR-2]